MSLAVRACRSHYHCQVSSYCLSLVFYYHQYNCHCHSNPHHRSMTRQIWRKTWAYFLIQNRTNIAKRVGRLVGGLGSTEVPSMAPPTSCLRLSTDARRRVNQQLLQRAQRAEKHLPRNLVFSENFSPSLLLWQTLSRVWQNLADSFYFCKIYGFSSHFSHIL